MVTRSISLYNALDNDYSSFCKTTSVSEATIPRNGEIQTNKSFSRGSVETRQLTVSGSIKRTLPSACGWQSDSALSTSVY